MKKGLFITFEGVDGCGKSTQARFLAEYLKEQGMDAVLTREPGGCEISELIRDIILNVKNTAMSSHTEALMYAAARAQLVDEVIRPALNAGRIVICDRFFDSSAAYQGFGRGLGIEYVLGINAHAVESCMPDATFFMDFSPQDARHRMHRRTEKDRLESEPDEFFERVYAGFSALKQRYPERYICVDVSGTKYETRDKIYAHAAELLEKWRNS